MFFGYYYYYYYYCQSYEVFCNYSGPFSLAAFGGKRGISGDTPQPGKGLRPLHPSCHQPGFQTVGK